jgi:Cof subfamily protein (haloacid dehalogenase superfamily)
MSVFKLAAIDLDDTLLNDKKEISDFTVEIIKSAVNKGIIIVLATGRSFRGARRYYDKLNLVTPMITCGGAVVADNNCNELFSLPINPDITKKILIFAKENNIHAQIENSTGYCFENHNKYSKQHEIFYGFPGDEIPDLINKENILASKVLILSEPEILNIIQPKAEKLFPELLISRSLPSFLEFNNPESSKGVALKFITSYFGLESQQVIAFGDSELDLHMMEYAGYCVAVENAAQKILDMADYVSTSNNEDGVAEAIIKLVL